MQVTYCYRNGARRAHLGPRDEVDEQHQTRRRCFLPLSFVARRRGFKRSKSEAAPPALHPMIDYKRTSWYGLGYLFPPWQRGTVLIRCIPAAVVAGTFNALLVAGIVDLSDGSTTGGASGYLSHPYTFQLVGIVFGYLMVTRINMSYSRYWEGVTMVKNMHSKWSDACGQIIAFDRALSTECNLTSDPFCCHVVRLFSQMSAMATMRLHVVEPGESLRFDAIEGKHPARVHLPHLSKKGKGSKSSASIAPEGSEFIRQSTAKLSLDQHSSLRSVTKAAEHHSDDGKLKRQRTKAEKINELGDGISQNERALLLAAPCPVFATAQRIQRAIITRLHSGGMRAPPPIISRIFQEVSNGLLFYNNATKMKEVPVPFPYVQLNAFLLNVFSCVLCPIAIASFTPVMWLSVSTTVVTVVSFYAVFLVANELEDPFGTEDNDMPSRARLLSQNRITRPGPAPSLCA